MEGTPVLGMALLGLTVLATLVIGAGFIIALRSKKRDLALVLLTVMGIWLGTYAIVLVTTSLTSIERVLKLNEEKRFCGFYLDCHLAASVTQVSKVKTLGNPPDQKTANGEYYIVTLKVSSDARAATLNLAEPSATIVDSQGREYGRAIAVENELEAAQGKSITLDQPVGPNGAYYTKNLVFDLPAGVLRPSLLVTEGFDLDRFIELFIIGDEDSLLHKHTLISLEP